MQGGLAAWLSFSSFTLCASRVFDRTHEIVSITMAAISANQLKASSLPGMNLRPALRFMGDLAQMCKNWILKRWILGEDQRTGS